MRAMEIALDLGEDGKMEKGGGMIQRTSQSLYQGRMGVLTKTENSKGVQGAARSTGGNNTRRETGGGYKEVRNGTNGGEGWRNRGPRTLPYPEYVRRREKG